MFLFFVIKMQNLLALYFKPNKFYLRRFDFNWTFKYKTIKEKNNMLWL